MAELTRHAVERTKRRVGVPKGAAAKNAERALQDGIKHSDTAGSLNRYFTALYFRHQTADNIRIYCDMVYIFVGERLITVYPLPQRYRRIAANVKKKNRGD